jgi:hypothetical protein
VKFIATGRHDGRAFEAMRGGSRTKTNIRITWGRSESFLLLTRKNCNLINLALFSLLLRSSRASQRTSFRCTLFSTSSPFNLNNNSSCINKHLLIPKRMASSLPKLPEVPGTDPSSCVFDAFRTAIAKKVSDALPELTLEQVYSGVDYGKKGVDFTIALPRFRLKEKVDVLAKKIIDQVS